MNPSASTTLPDADMASPVRLLHEWQRLTQEGLSASRAYRTLQAIAWHMRALRVARQLLQHPPAGVSDDDRLATCVVSHLNMADCYADMDEAAQAAQCLICAHRRLMTLLRNPATAHPLRSAASRQLRQTYAVLCEYRRQHGEHPLIEQALDECQAHWLAAGALLH